MRGILMGALGGAGKGLAENGKAAMEEEAQMRRESRDEESKMRMKRSIMELEKEALADREAAIRARREKVMSTAKTPEEIERAGLIEGDEGLAKYGAGVIERNLDAEKAKTDEDWKQKEYNLKVGDQKIRQQALSLRGQSGGRSVGGLSTTGFSTAAREDQARAQLAEKVASGKASAEERAQFQVLQDVAANRTGKAEYVPTEAKKADYWRSAPPEEVEAEVDRQLISYAMKTSGEMRRIERDPEYAESLRDQIRRRLGVAAGETLWATDPLQNELDALFPVR